MGREPNQPSVHPDVAVNGETPDTEATAAVALRQATERLCTVRNPAAVSIRDIASEAGLSPGLVYHYYESREQLFGVTLRAIAEDMMTEVGDDDSPGSIARTVLDSMYERPVFARMITALILDGHDVTELMGRHPLIERLTTLGGSGRDARVRSALAVGILLGAGVYGDRVIAAAAAPEEIEALRSAQAETLASLFSS